MQCQEVSVNRPITKILSPILEYFHSDATRGCESSEIIRPESNMGFVKRTTLTQLDAAI